MKVLKQQRVHRYLFVLPRKALSLLSANVRYFLVCVRINRPHHTARARTINKTVTFPRIQLAFNCTPRIYNQTRVRVNFLRLPDFCNERYKTTIEPSSIHAHNNNNDDEILLLKPRVPLLVLRVETNLSVLGTERASKWLMFWWRGS